MAEETLLQKYADLVVRVGANVQEGQDVIIFALVEHASFVRSLAAAAYEAGARYVGAAYGDQHVKRELIVHASDDVLEWSAPWELERINHLAREGGAMISITGFNTLLYTGCMNCEMYIAENTPSGIARSSE
jgi:aminopeptidase